MVVRAFMSSKYTLDGTPENQKCDHLIHAIPYGSNSDTAPFSFDQDQEDVLSQLVYEPYWTTFVKMSELEFGERYYPVLFPSSAGLTYQEFEGVGEPIGLFKQLQVSPYVSVYSWHKPPLPEGFSNADINALTDQYLGWLNLNEDEDGNPIPLEIEANFEWSAYFPHVITEAIDNGWFQDLENLQGYRKTYFTGGYRTMDTIESVVRSAEDIIDRFF